MTGLLEPLRELLASAIATAGPTAVFGIAGAVSGAIAALLVAALCRSVLLWIRGRRVRVASLARRGASRAEIARRTGLSQDAVGMLLCVRAVPRGRRNLPAAARIAAPRAADARRRNRDWNPQLVGAARVAASVGRGAGSARALPSPRASAMRLTRSGQAA